MGRKLGLGGNRAAVACAVLAAALAICVVVMSARQSAFMDSLINGDGPAHAKAIERLRRPDERAVYDLAASAGGDDEQGRRALGVLNEAGAPVVSTLCSIVEGTEHNAWTRYERVMRTKVGAARALGGMRAAEGVPAMCRALAWGGWLEYLSLGGEGLEWCRIDPYLLTVRGRELYGRGDATKSQGCPKPDKIQLDYGAYYFEMQTAVLGCGKDAVKPLVHTWKYVVTPPLLQGMRFSADAGKTDEKLLAQWGPEPFLAEMAADHRARDYVLGLFLRTKDTRAVSGLVARLAVEPRGSGYDIAYVLLHMRTPEAFEALAAFDEKERKVLEETKAQFPRVSKAVAHEQRWNCCEYVVLRSDTEMARRLWSMGWSRHVDMWCKYHGVPLSEVTGTTESAP